MTPAAGLTIDDDSAEEEPGVVTVTRDGSALGAGDYSYDYDEDNGRITLSKTGGGAFDVGV